MKRAHFYVVVCETVYQVVRFLRIYAKLMIPKSTKMTSMQQTQHRLRRVKVLNGPIPYNRHKSEVDYSKIHSNTHAHSICHHVIIINIQHRQATLYNMTSLSIK